MVDKISVEFEALDSKLSNTIKELDTKLNNLGDSANYSKSLQQNITELNANIQKVEQLKSSIISAQKEIGKLTIPASGTNRSRQNANDALNALHDTSARGSRSARNSVGYDRPIPNSRATAGTPSYYTPRLNEPAMMARQREDARQELRETRSRYAGLSRDAGTANRSVLQSNRRIGNRIQSGGYITANEKITATNNLNSARNILTDNGRYDSINGRIDSLNNTRNSNNASRDAIQSQIQDMTRGGRGNLSSSQARVVQELEHQRNLLIKENEGIDSYTKKLNSIKNNYTDLQNTMNSSDAKYAPTSGLSSILYKRSLNIANGVVYGGAAATAGLAMRGLSTINSVQPYTRAIGASNGTYNSRASQVSAQNAGMRYGITGSEMLQYENSYMQNRGYTSQSDMNNAGVQTGMFSKLTGMTATQSNALTSVYANSTNENSQGLRDLQNTFYGSLKQAGLTNKTYGQASQLTNILGTYSTLRGGDANSNALSGQVSMQSALASTGSSALTGQNGANFMNQMNSAIIGQGGNSKFMQTALMMSNSSKYNGSASGYANIIGATQQGLTGGNLSSIVNLGNQYTQGMSKKDSDLIMSQALNNNFGTQLTGKSYSSIRRLAASGDLDGLNKSDTIKKLQSEGAITAKEAKSMQQSSSDSSADKGTAAFEKASTTVGNLTRNLISFGQRMTGGSAAITILGTAAAGAAVALGKIALSTGLSNVIKGGVSGGGGSGTGGTGLFGTLGGKSANAASKSTGILSKVTNSRAGQAVTSGLETLGATRFGGVVKSGASKATGLFSSAASKVMPIASKAAGFAGKSVPWLSAGLSGLQLASDYTGGASKKQKSTDAWGLAGTVAGTILGTPFGPGGMMIGSMLGNLAGSGLGNMLGSSGSKEKDDQSLTNKKIQSEQMRAKNIKADDEFVNKYGRTVTAKDILQGNSSSNSVSSDDSTSPFEDYKNTGARNGSAGTSVTHNVVISGNVNHTGSVADMSDVDASTDSVLSSLFGNSTANETKRY